MEQPPLLQPLAQPLHKMSQNDLQKCLPDLIRQSLGSKRVEYGKETSKPKWWPKELPWSNPMVQPKATRSGRQAHETKKFTDILRSAVKNCYIHHGMDHLLSPNSKTTRSQHLGKPTTQLPEEATSLPESASSAEPVPSMSDHIGGAAVPDEEPSEAALPTASSAITGPAEAPAPFMEIFICFYCDMEFSKKTDLQLHQKECKQRVENCKDSPQPLSERAKYKPFQASSGNVEWNDKLPAVKYPVVQKARFVEHLGLISLDKAKKLSNQQNKDKKLLVDCDVIEIIDDADIKSPPTPRTPKSLISQLSRDLSPTRVKRLIAADLETDDEDDDDIESVSSKSCDKDGEHHPRKMYAVLNIDYCSPLGQLIKNNIKQNAEEQYGHNAACDSDDENETNQHYEAFCSTPKKHQLAGMLQKLRNRPSQIPITFKKSTKHCRKYNFIYKFTQKQRREQFLTKEAGGLNRRSRKLKRQWIKKKCFVKIERLKADVIKKWTARKPTPHVSLKAISPELLNRWNYFQKQMQNTYPGQGPKSNAALLNSCDTLRQMLGTHALQDMRYTAPYNSVLVTNDQRAIVYKSMLCQISNSVANENTLTPPATPEGAHPTPGILIPNQNNSLLAAMLGPNGVPMYNRPQTARRTGGHVQIHKPSTGITVPPGSNTFADITNAKVGIDPEPICIDLSDDDVVSISSTDTESSTKTSSSKTKRKRKAADTKSSRQPMKRPRIETVVPPSPMLLFKCHLCHAEITCKDNFANCIKSHFISKHGVTNINLIEHTDASGQKVVSIVEEAQPRPVQPVLPTPNRSLPRALFPCGPAQVNRMQSNQQNQASMEVICLD